MGNPGIANLCQDARGGEFGQANLAIPQLGSTFFIAIAILRHQRGLNDKYINMTF